ncbi:hypothetical protein WJX84_004440 [Apatococcus fuscideae]|uniref:Transcription initiation factor TFIID subunit 2 n=1 Tax=Apatococcus fuscideae TaxID=2026836 RepID=A0AAW1SS30_9CHLO
MQTSGQPQVLHQHLKIVVDTERQLVFGSTDISLRAPRSSSHIGLHSLGLDVASVRLGGKPAAFHLQASPAEEWPSVLDDTSRQGPDVLASELAEESYYQYERILQQEAQASLFVELPRTQEDMDINPALAAALGASREVTLSIKYRTRQPACGLRFSGPYAFTDMQLRRARAWFPCIDTPQAACSFQLQITVAADQTAVASGLLEKQTWSPDGAQKTFFYTQAIPMPACQIALTVGPFAVHAGTPSHQAIQRNASGSGTPAAAAPPFTPRVLPTATPLHVSSTPYRPSTTPSRGAGYGLPNVEATITHFGPPDRPAELAHSAKVFPLIFNLYEVYLGTKFPFGCLQQAIVPVGDALPTAVAGAGCVLLPENALVNSRAIEQAVDSRLLMARMMAEQWFGFYMRPKTAADAWLVQGLAGYLEEKFVLKYMGRNELDYRQWRQRQAIYMADDGQAPPLYIKVPPETHPWGWWQGTEALEPCEMRRWKATAIMNMLEARAPSEDKFKKMLAGWVFEGSTQNKGDKSGDKRAVGTKEFLQLLKKNGIFSSGEGIAFVARWVKGAGCARVSTAFAFNRKKNGGTLEIALRQSGSESARQAATASLAQAKAQGNEGLGMSSIKVSVQDAPESQMDYPVHLGVAATALLEVRVHNKGTTKAGAKRKRKKAEVEGDDEEEQAEDTEVGDLPVWWVRLDRFGEWLADTRVLQTEQMWALQLQRSRDVAAQAAAVAGLAAMRPATFGAANALQACLQNPSTYCRVRMDAAVALGDMADVRTNNLMGLQALLQVLRERLTDSRTSEVRSNNFSDLSQYYIDQALPMAIARVRDSMQTSPPEAVHALVDALTHEDNRGNLYDDSTFLAGLLQALGHLVPHNQKMLDLVLEQLERFLQREQVLPSFQNLVGCMCITSLAQLAAAAKQGHPCIARIRALCQRHESWQGSPWRMQVAAKLALACFQPASHSIDKRIEAALDASPGCQPKGWTACRLQLMDTCLRLVNGQLSQQLKMEQTQLSMSGDGNAPKAAAQGTLIQAISSGLSAPGDGPQVLHGVSVGILRRIHALMLDHSDPRLRHRAFLLLQRIGGRPAHFNPHYSEPVLPQGPAGPGANVKKAQPATSAVSLGMTGMLSQGGGPGGGDEGTSHIRVRLRPSKSTAGPASSSLSGSPSIAAMPAQDTDGLQSQPTPGSQPLLGPANPIIPAQQISKPDLSAVLPAATAGTDGQRPLTPHRPPSVPSVFASADQAISQPSSAAGVMLTPGSNNLGPAPLPQAQDAGASDAHALQPGTSGEPPASAADPTAEAQAPAGPADPSQDPAVLAAEGIMARGRASQIQQGEKKQKRKKEKRDKQTTLITDPLSGSMPAATIPPATTQTEPASDSGVSPLPTPSAPAAAVGPTAAPTLVEADKKRLKAEKREKRRQNETPEQRAERKKAKKDRKDRKRSKSDMPTPSGASSPTETVNASVQQSGF